MGQRMNNPLQHKLGQGRHWVDEGLAEVGDTAQDGGKFIKFKDRRWAERAGTRTPPGAKLPRTDRAMPR